MIIPAVISALILGVAFDAPSLSYKPHYIFDPDDIRENLVSIQNPFTNTQYRVIEMSSEANDFLNVDGELALKAKHGWEGTLQGVGKYLANPIDRKKTIELLCTVKHETVAETFPSYTRQREEWKSKRPEQVGTHYIRSIMYGGQLVASYKLVVDREEDMEEVKTAVDASLAKEGSFDARVAGSLQMLKNTLGSKYREEISVFATTGVFNPPSNIEGLLTLIQEYPGMVRKVNNGKGAPVRVDIEPISSLDSRFGTPRSNYGMESMFQEAINKLEDLKVADKEFKEWEKKNLWNDEQQEEIDAYYAALRTAFSSMKNAINNIFQNESMDPAHLQQALRDYGHGRENIPNRYTRELRNLTHHVENIPFYWYPYTTATTHYIHWGSINCSLPSPDPVYVGYAASSPKGFGNGADVLCLDIEPQFESSDAYTGPPTSRLTGLTYETPSQATGFAYCAFCRLENATAVEVVAGRTTCPSDMKLEYAGYLATNLNANSRFVCMSEHPDDKVINLHARKDGSAGKLVPVWVKCEDCEGEEDWEKSRYVSCAVCSR